MYFFVRLREKKSYKNNKQRLSISFLPLSILPSTAIPWSLLQQGDWGLVWCNPSQWLLIQQAFMAASIWLLSSQYRLFLFRIIIFSWINKSPWQWFLLSNVSKLKQILLYSYVFPMWKLSNMFYGGMKIWLNSSPPGQNGSKNYSWQIWKDHWNYAVARVRSGTIHPEQYTPECIWSGCCFIAANRMLHVCCDHGKGPFYSHG